jgi:cold shock CspA family protein
MAQGTVKSYDPHSKQGFVLMDGSYEELPLAIDALHGSIFRFLREGQRVVGDVVEREGARQLTRLRLGQDNY